LGKNTGMADHPTCGQGLAERSQLPKALAELFDRSAENLEFHVDALRLSDDRARTERDVWLRVAEQHRVLAVQMRTIAELMGLNRDLPAARHDPEVLSSPRVVGAFKRFVAAEQEVAALLEEWVERDRERLREASGEAS
jgi:hypothetical protein